MSNHEDLNPEDLASPEDSATGVPLHDRIDGALACATEHFASYLVARELGEPGETLALWVDRVWDGLREQLDDDDRINAIARLIEPEAERVARETLRPITHPDAPPIVAPPSLSARPTDAEVTEAEALEFRRLRALILCWDRNPEHFTGGAPMVLANLVAIMKGWRP